MPGWETFTSDYPGARMIYVQDESDHLDCPGNQLPWKTTAAT